MKILCVCTSGKDRSPIMAEYLLERGHDSYAVGINEYFTEKNDAPLIMPSDLLFADKILVVSPIHAAFVRGMLHASPVCYHDPIIITIPVDEELDKNMSREEFVWYVRAVMDKRIKMIERE